MSGTYLEIKNDIFKLYKGADLIAEMNKQDSLDSSYYDMSGEDEEDNDDDNWEDMLVCHDDEDYEDIHVCHDI